MSLPPLGGHSGDDFTGFNVSGDDLNPMRSIHDDLAHKVFKNLRDAIFDDPSINPKHAAGSAKMPMHLWPDTASAMGAIAFLEGKLKYGAYNYRGTAVSAMVYWDAAVRHLNAWRAGEEADPVTKVPHLGYALACLAILVDTQAAGSMVDDRPIRGGYLKLLEQLTPLVNSLKEMFTDKNPKHYTIQDIPHAERNRGVDPHGIRPNDSAEVRHIADGRPQEEGPKRARPRNRPSQERPAK